MHPPEREPADARGPAPFLVAPRVLGAVLVAATLFVVAMLVVRALAPERGLRWTILSAGGTERLAPGWSIEAPPEGTTLAAGDPGSGAGIRRIALAPGARARIDLGSDRLFLELGSARASGEGAASAFEIETPAGVVSDLGGEFEVEVDADGAARLAVDAGEASLAGSGRVAFVPAGYAARARPGVAPGVPLPPGCAAEVAALVGRLDAAEPPADADLAALAGIEDEVVLLHLLAARAPAVRAAARDALLGRGTPPAEVDPGAPVRDEAAWRAWRAALAGRR